MNDLELLVGHTDQAFDVVGFGFLWVMEDHHLPTLRLVLGNPGQVVQELIDQNAVTIEGWPICQLHW